MTRRPALFLLGHGSRDGGATAEALRLAAMVAERAPGLAVGCGFLELSEPFADDAIDRLVAEGAPADVVVVPYVLLGAGHLKDDGPAVVARARRRHPQVRFSLARDLGVDPALLDLAEERARSVLAPPVDPVADAVLLVGRGSTDPDANADFVKLARLVEDGRGLGTVQPAFVQLAQPDVAGGLDRLHRLGARRVAVVPLLLFTGVLLSRIHDQAVAWRAEHPELEVAVAPHAGPDARLAGLVLRRYDEALHGDVRMNCDLCSYRVRLPGYEAKVGQPLVLAPPERGSPRGWRARREAARAQQRADEQRRRPRRGFGRAAPYPPPPDRGVPAVAVRGLRHTWPDGRPSLQGVDLVVAAGERVAVVGPNGAGKTTLAHCLLGLLEPDAGHVTVTGVEVEERNLPLVRHRAGLVFQHPDDQLFCATVAEDVAFGPRNLGLDPAEVQLRVEEALAAVSLEDAADLAPHRLSMGERRRAALATVLSMGPEVLVLDEPTADLDPAARRDLCEILRTLPATMLVVTHDLPFALELCPRTVVLDAGVVAADGDTRALLANAGLLAAHRLELPYGLDPWNAAR